MSGYRTDRGLDRLVNFSDATVAIAITLLILPLVDAAGHIGKLSVGAFLGEHIDQVLAFLISFVVIARFWVVHHRLFEWVDRYTGRLVWLNFIWLGAIVVMPFTTNVVSNSVDRADVHAFYIGNMLVAAVSTQAIGGVIQRAPGLAKEEARSEIEPIRGWATTLLMALALVLSVVLPEVGLWWLFLLFLTEPVYRLLKRALRARSSQPTG